MLKDKKRKKSELSLILLCTAILLSIGATEKGKQARYLEEF